MNPKHENLTSQNLAEIATDFENRDFTPDEVTTIKRTRRRSPRIGDSKAEVLTFRAPSDYKDRIKERAKSDHKSESQIIRDALDAYL